MSTKSRATGSNGSNRTKTRCNWPICVLNTRMRNSVLNTVFKKRRRNPNPVTTTWWMSTKTDCRSKCNKKMMISKTWKTIYSSWNSRYWTFPSNIRVRSKSKRIKLKFRRIRPRRFKRNWKRFSKISKINCKTYSKTMAKKKKPCRKIYRFSRTKPISSRNRWLISNNKPNIRTLKCNRKTQPWKHCIKRLQRRNPTLKTSKMSFARNSRKPRTIFWRTRFNMNGKSHCPSSRRSSCRTNWMRRKPPMKRVSPNLSVICSNRKNKSNRRFPRRFSALKVRKRNCKINSIHWSKVPRWRTIPSKKKSTNWRRRIFFYRNNNTARSRTLMKWNKTMFKILKIWSRRSKKCSKTWMTRVSLLNTKMTVLRI